MNILCIGDIVGRPGRFAVERLLPDLTREFSLDCIIANAENSAGGNGLTKRIAQELFAAGCHVLTLGDHTWDQKEIEGYLDTTNNVIRPANFPTEAPGKGWTVVTLPSGEKVGVINVLGRTFMRYHVECPFKTVERLIGEVKKEASVIVVDFHAEVTSEKIAMSHFLNGKASVLFGTHTHVQTGDEQIMSEGTAYLTDLGMTGPHDSVIGQNKEAILKRFLTSMPIKFSVATGDLKLNGVVVEVDSKTGKATKITRISREVEYVEEEARV